MRPVQRGPLIGLVALDVLLAVLGGGGRARRAPAGSPGWPPRCVVTGAALGPRLARSGAPRLGPADRVTLTRAVLACGVAALVAAVPLRRDAVGGRCCRPGRGALALDAVDGRVARRTGHASRARRAASTWRSTPS